MKGSVFTLSRGLKKFMKKAIKYVAIGVLLLFVVGFIVTAISMSKSGEAQKKMNQGFDQAKQDIESK